MLNSLYGPAANMVNWVACMRKFRGAYKMIAPLMAMVQEKGEELAYQQGKLKDAQDELAQVKANVAQLNADLKVFQDQADEKTEILDEFQKKLRVAKNLIDSLEINRVRWEKDKTTTTTSKSASSATSASRARSSPIAGRSTRSSGARSSSSTSRKSRSGLSSRSTTIST